MQIKSYTGFETAKPDQRLQQCEFLHLYIGSTFYLPCVARPGSCRVATDFTSHMTQTRVSVVGQKFSNFPLEVPRALQAHASALSQSLCGRKEPPNATLVT